MRFFILILTVGFGLNLFAYDELSKAECVVIEEENAIYCKYVHTRTNIDKVVKFNWIEPDGTISRSRDMLIPPGHGSVYDYRYLQGRSIGVWTFEVIDNNQSIKTTFEIK
jgi:hypothetical protein